MNTFRIDTRGQWSGGGQVVLNNLLELAGAAHGLVQPGARGAITILPRNVPTSWTVLAGRFVWMPQNALPWGPPAPEEARLQRMLRWASAVVGHRATAMVRISGAIPPLRRRRTSPVLHNVLDSSFDDLANRLAPRPHGRFLVAGSAHSYRMLPELVVGYGRYREGGGRTGLLVQTSPGTPSQERRLRAGALEVDDLEVVIGGAERRRVLELMAGSVGVVFPSSVEASPVTVLEAQAVGRPIAASDIAGHRGILAGSPWESFRPADPENVAAALHRLDEYGGSAPHPLQDGAERARQRLVWGQALTDFLITL